MIENVGRKVALIFVLLAAAALLLTFLRPPIPLGLDLAGGVRMVYRLDLEQARRDGQIGANEDPLQVLEDTIAIIRTRVDPNGVVEPIIRSIGTDRIEIQIPGTAEVTGTAATGKLGAPVAGSGDEAALRAPIRLDASDPKALEGFPGGGGVIRIGQEKIRYGARVGPELQSIQRGESDTGVADHAAGTEVVLVSDDAVQNAIQNLGDLRFYIATTNADFQKAGADEITERAKVVEWLKANPTTSIKVYNSLPRDKNGPPPGIVWFPHRGEEGAQFVAREDRLVSLSVPPAEWTFAGESLARIYKSVDRTGFPAVGFEMRPKYADAFGQFTEAHLDEGMSIVLNDEIVTIATINSPLPGGGQIEGRFTDRRVDEMVTVLRSGSLKIKPTLEAREEIGATIGQEAVDQGWIMGALALLVVGGFMVFYYRELGVFATIGLVYGLVLQMGALAAFRATLTMPGIAGIILGIGMAVDANILIFTRIREEQEAGKKPLQAAKAGFQNAFPAIFDSNVTTILAGVILYYVGTGPIRGFAVTLIIGVLTSMFSALVVVRVLIHYRLQRRPDKPFTMLRWLADANYRILDKTRIAIGVSLALMIAGIVLFASLPVDRKFGIDFLGGATAKVRTEAPHTKDEVVALVKAIPGDIGESAEVAALPASKTADGRHTEFRVTFKTPEKEGVEASSEETFKSEIRRGLASILQKGPIELQITPGQGENQVSGSLYFDGQHAQGEVAQQLEKARLTNVQVSVRPNRANVFEFTAIAPADLSDVDLRTLIRTAYTDTSDSAGRVFALADPVPEGSVIGSRVVGELRDSAIKALLLSMLVTVIYLRVRFAEYSFGIAAVIAIIHDILITLGAIAFLVWVPWIHVEFDMGTIAVFLTIVGYSVNDTIVVFDRIRENRPRMKGSLREIVNTSINQTLSRTIITSTAIATIFIVLIFNLGRGNVLEGFSFTMLFGIATGTFSSIFIAAPIFVWLEERAQLKATEQSQHHKPKVAPDTP